VGYLAREAQQQAQRGRAEGREDDAKGFAAAHGVEYSP